MELGLPRFTYHPDPVSTGSVASSSEPCDRCGQARGFVYRGPVYSATAPEGVRICPWCIADGSAHERWAAEFCDVGVGDLAHEAPRDVVEKVAQRTPGYTAWQTPYWLAHCGDACEFQGLAAAADLVDKPDAVAMLREQGLEDDDIDALERDEDSMPTAYLFHCRHCGRWLSYFDMT